MIHDEQEPEQPETCDTDIQTTKVTEDKDIISEKSTDTSDKDRQR